ncbi:hypothetical protein BO70DRAFT_342773 [Aspergillus heteromorphus CBS 117.55]|uniref:Uncharacterized protein n=1 Tax=Aspergillus heteromorphus CBS 117.55 TaxID=1448321 RepID=A0A317VCI8_9EURO|nr:uncharacterized protein BO70DRAFT_342773 [Aspergillus heteromorphus CBS 117.55]PWY71705.1 hypothetical protein BO70DRAFT_342773 [Aspergillus heteromorphus CBS 117.55]
MAPVLVHPSYPSLIPRSTLPAAAHATPIKVTKYIGLKVLLQLFAGTAVIFVLAVFFWKIGKFCRYLTQDKVFKSGNTTTTRYARTWYGWVSAQRHEDNKKAFRRCFRKIWTTSDNEYRWVWWDPGQKELETYRERKRLSRWLPRWLRNYSYIAADTIWNPGPPPCQNASALREASYLSGTSIGTNLSIQLYLQQDSHQMTFQRMRKPDQEIQMKSARKGRYKQERLRLGNSEVICQNRSNYSAKAMAFRSDSADLDSVVVRSLSLPCLVSYRGGFQQISMFSDASQSTHTTIILNRAPALKRPRGLQSSRKYQVWSTRLELKTSKCLGFLGPPPGSPRSKHLTSRSSDQMPLSRLAHQDRVHVNTISTTSSHLITFDCRKRHGTETKRPAEETYRLHHERWLSTESSCSQIHLHRRTLTSASDDRRVMCRGDRQEHGRSSRGKKPMHVHHPNTKTSKKKEPDVKWNAAAKVPIRQLSNWEILFIDSLDRKLNWLHNQLSPGRRPYHFAMLANHWLNKETWLVIDPPSRISIDAKRRYGDSRFNVPFPNTSWGPNPKYPKKSCKAIRSPRIDSWRAAVNRNRRASGLQDIVNAFRLYDTSVDNPPDGKVDPASWILRKPPQGLELSARERQVYYEGGAGFQETLDDWQKVRRGYRIRKAITDGKVNRTRAKEIALGITRYYRAVTCKPP